MAHSAFIYTNRQRPSLIYNVYAVDLCLSINYIVMARAHISELDMRHCIVNIQILPTPFLACATAGISDCLNKNSKNKKILRINLHISWPSTHVSGFELTSTNTVGVHTSKTSRSAILKFVKKMFVEFRMSFVFSMTMGTFLRDKT